MFSSERWRVSMMSQLAPEHLRELLRMWRDRHARTEMPKTLCEEQKKGRHERLDFVVFFRQERRGTNVQSSTRRQRRARMWRTNERSRTDRSGHSFSFCLFSRRLSAGRGDGRQETRKMDGKGGVVNCKVTAVARGSTSCSVVGGETSS